MYSEPAEAETERGLGVVVETSMKMLTQCVTVVKTANDVIYYNW